MQVYLLMYQSHERAAPCPLMAFKNKADAENHLKETKIGAAQSYQAITIKEIKLL